MKASNNSNINETSRMSKPLVIYDSGYDKTRIQRMYQYPALMKDALMHKKAYAFGYNSKKMPDSKNKSVPLCPCCELPINTVRIPIGYGTTPSKDNVKTDKQVFMLNAGASMYFTFIKMAIVYLLLRFLLSDCYNLITNSVSTSCNLPENSKLCTTNIMAKFSSYNKNTSEDEPFLYVVDILNLITIVCSIAFFTYYRRYQYQVFEVADLLNHSQSDYSIFVENIPIFLPSDPLMNRNIECNYQQELKTIFEKLTGKWITEIKNTQGVGTSSSNSSSLDAAFYKLIQENPSIQKAPIVTSVSLCFDLTEMEKLNTIREKLMEEHNNNVDKNKSEDTTSIYYIPNQIECLNREYIQLSKKFAMENSISFNLSHFVGKAFVSFQYEHIKQYFLEYFRDNQKIQINEKPLKISAAAEPSDIYWFNMKVHKSDRRNSVIYSYGIMFLTLGFSFVLIFGLQFYQFSTSTDLDTTTQTTQEIIFSYFFTIVMTTLTTAINFLLASVCQKLTEWEKHKTKTDYIVSLMIKSVLSQFLNTALIYYIISVVANITLDSEKSSPFSQNGLVMKVTSLVAVSGGLQIFLNAVQMGTLFSCLLNSCKFKNKQTVNRFQVELNQQIQDPEFDFSDRYAYYIVNVFVISFFSYITPYISIILALIFVVQYWVDKYNLFQRFSCPTDFNFRLSRMTLKAFQASIFVFALGNYIFSFTVHPTKDESEYHIVNLIALILAGVYCVSIFLLPKKWFEKLDVESYEKSSYIDNLKEKNFNKVYWLSNPATSFAKEPDLNNPSKFVDYVQIEEFADSSDFDKVVNLELKGGFKVETYSKEQEKQVKQIVEDLKNEIEGMIVAREPEGEMDILARINQATKN